MPVWSVTLVRELPPRVMPMPPSTLQPRWVAQLSYSGKFHNYNIGLATLRFKRHYFDKIKYFLVFFYLIKKVVNTPTLFKF